MIMKSLHVRLVVVMQVYRSAQKTKLTWIKGKTLTDTVLQFHRSEAWLKIMIAVLSFKIFHFYASSAFAGLQKVKLMKVG